MLVFGEVVEREVFLLKAGEIWGLTGMVAGGCGSGSDETWESFGFGGVWYS